MTSSISSHLFTDFFLIAQGGGSTQGQGAGSMNMLLMMVLMFVIFYFVLIRPQRKRQKELEAMIAAVKVGDDVVTNAGIHGVIANVKERTVVIKVSDSVRIEFDKSAIATVLKKEEPAA